MDIIKSEYNNIYIISFSTLTSAYSSESECKNSGTYTPEKCLGWVNSGFCKGEHEKFMLHHCKKTCGCKGEWDMEMGPENLEYLSFFTAIYSKIPRASQGQVNG